VRGLFGRIGRATEPAWLAPVHLFQLAHVGGQHLRTPQVTNQVMRSAWTDYQQALELEAQHLAHRILQQLVRVGYYHVTLRRFQD
jgi:hypothetical protein